MERQQTEGNLIPPSWGTWGGTEVMYLRLQRAEMKQTNVLARVRYVRHDGVGGDDVLHLLGPGVHEAEPSAP